VSVSGYEKFAFAVLERTFKEVGLPCVIRTDIAVPFASAHAIYGSNPGTRNRTAGITLSAKQSNASAACTIQDHEEHTSANRMSPINCRLVVSALWP
jgi:hypothetical protein